MTNWPSIQIFGLVLSRCVDEGTKTRLCSILKGSVWFDCSLLSTTNCELKSVQLCYWGLSCLLCVLKDKMSWVLVSLTVVSV